MCFISDVGGLRKIYTCVRQAPDGGALLIGNHKFCSDRSRFHLMQCSVSAWYPSLCCSSRLAAFLTHSYVKFLKATWELFLGNAQALLDALLGREHWAVRYSYHVIDMSIY
jgi:hypothetical protein